MLRPGTLSKAHEEGRIEDREFVAGAFFFATLHIMEEAIRLGVPVTERIQADGRIVNAIAVLGLEKRVLAALERHSKGL